MFLKNHVVNEGEVSGQCISLGGTKMEEGRTWGSSQDLMSRNFTISNSSLEMEKLSSLKVFRSLLLIRIEPVQVHPHQD